MDRKKEILQKLKSLTREQFCQLLFLLEIPDAELPDDVSQAEKAIEIYYMLKPQHDGLRRLEETLEHPSIKRLSSQSAASPIKAQVDQIVSDYTQLFVGRDKEEQQLDNFLKQNRRGMLLVRAGAGMGKTALLANWKQKQQQQGNGFIAYHFFRQGEETSNVIQAYRYLLRQLYTYYELTTPQIPTNEYELKDRICHLLQEPREGKPLVILLDALDEATPERSLSLTLPQPLPEGLYVIASVRLNKEEKLDNLPPWIQVTKELPLEHLPSLAIADWLRRAGNGELATLAQDETFVAQACDRTEGIPLFLKYLIDELVQVAKQGEESAIRNTLAATPKGFANYIRQQYQALDRLEDWRSRPDLRKIFYFLTIAKGELSSDDLVELMGDPAGLPWQVSRWFRIRELEDFLLFSFAHPSLAEQFAALPAIKANTKKAQKELINYCAHWQEYHSAYALRHYAEHLRDVKRWEELYAIARNPDFASTQQQQLPDEPDLPLKTVQTALLGSAEEDRAEAMAEFVLIHAHRLGQTNAQESPLEALRSGSLKRAWVLAEHFEIERCILWYLLLVWELKDKGKLEEARKTLERLERKELPCFSLNSATLGYGDYAAYLLAYIFALNQDTYTIIVHQLLDNHHRRLLCKILSEHGDFDALKGIASSQAEEREFINYADRLETTEEINNQTEPQNNLWTIAYAHAKASNFPAVLKITEGGIDGRTQIEALGFIAKALAEEGNSQTARATFATALQIERGAELSSLQASALIDVAEVQAKVEPNESGAATARIAHQITQKINNPREKVIAIAGIAEVLAKAGKGKETEDLFETAIEMTQTINSQDQRVNSFTVVAKAQVRVNKFADALNTAQKIEFPWRKAKVLAVIAKAQAEAEPGEKFQTTLTAAIEFAQGIPLEGEGIEVLIAIAEAQSVREKEMGLSTLTNLLEVARASRERAKHLSKIAAAQAKLGEIATALTIADDIEDELERVITLSWIALTQFKKGKKQELLKTLTTALQAKDKIEDKQKLMQALKAIAGMQVMAGKGEKAVRTAEKILTERNLYLPGIASWLVETGDLKSFKRLLIPCAYYLDAAYQMCGLLAKLDPDKAADIVKVVKEFTVSSTQKLVNSSKE